MIPKEKLFLKEGLKHPENSGFEITKTTNYLIFSKKWKDYLINLFFWEWWMHYFLYINWELEEHNTFSKRFFESKMTTWLWNLLLN